MGIEAGKGPDMRRRRLILAAGAAALGVSPARLTSQEPAKKAVEIVDEAGELEATVAAEEQELLRWIAERYAKRGAIKEMPPIKEFVKQRASSISNLSSTRFAIGAVLGSATVELAKEAGKTIRGEGTRPDDKDSENRSHWDPKTIAGGLVGGAAAGATGEMWPVIEAAKRTEHWIAELLKDPLMDGQTILRLITEKIGELSRQRKEHGRFRRKSSERP